MFQQWAKPTRVPESNTALLNFSAVDSSANSVYFCANIRLTVLQRWKASEWFRITAELILGKIRRALGRNGPWHLRQGHNRGTNVLQSHTLPRSSLGRPRARPRNLSFLLFRGGGGGGGGGGEWCRRWLSSSFVAFDRRTTRLAEQAHDSFLSMEAFCLCMRTWFFSPFSS